MSSKHHSVLTIFLIIVIACCCILGICYLTHGLPPAPPGDQHPTPTASATPAPEKTAPDLAEVPFAIDGHTTILPFMDVTSPEFRKTYGTLNIPAKIDEYLLLTFDQPVTSYDDAIALDFTIYGEPYHRILKKLNYGLDTGYISYEGRINTSDPATTFTITFGPKSSVMIDFPWNGSIIECKPVLDRTHTDEADTLLHAVYLVPGTPPEINWDELTPEQRQLEEWLQHHNDPDFVHQYETKLTLHPSYGRETETGATIVTITDDDIRTVPELQTLLTDQKAAIILNRTTYDESTYERSVRAKFMQDSRTFIEINGTYYTMTAVTYEITPWGKL
ncbi:MAG TPA: hypothetical protein O0Y06_02875 [Methanocorpusculum sp.]|nr:hypothetical protein [Methanocorpusculum sp.]HJK79830.1 hypothetical protein [Methanocorpusculum sp.]